jgi:hypothetical protein
MTMTVLEVLMHEMGEVLNDGVDGLADMVRRSMMVGHVVGSLDRLHAVMANEHPMTEEDMKDMAMMTLALPMLSTVAHLLSGRPWSFMVGFLAMAAPMYIIHHMEHEHEINKQ